MASSESTNSPTEGGKEATMALITNTNHGLLRVGDMTPLGAIEQVSLTAYRIGGEWVPFAKVHGNAPIAEPLAFL